MRERRASAVGLVLAAACSVQGGAAVAKTLFPQLGPPGVVFLRLLFGSAALWAIARPQLRGRARADLRLVAALGVVLVSMNITFYEALDRAPLGVVVTVEFLGPLAVAVLGSRKTVDLVWVGLAATGVALLADGGGTAVKPLGIVLAAVAGFFWALYILLSVRVGRAFTGATGLAPAMALGALLMAPAKRFVERLFERNVRMFAHHTHEIEAVAMAVPAGGGDMAARGWTSDKAAHDWQRQVMGELAAALREVPEEQRDEPDRRWLAFAEGEGRERGTWLVA